MLEGMKAQITRLEQQRVRDQEEASRRERRLERDNATLISALARGIEHQEGLDRTTESDRVATSQQTGAPTGTD